MAVPDAVPDAVAPPPRHPRFPLIDGLRAIAVFSVLVSHAAVAGEAVGPDLAGRLLAHLNVGVAIFFLISGFLLFRPFIARRNGGAEAPRTRDYARRRLLRIYPAYWLALTVLVLIPGVTGVHDGDWLVQYTLLQTLVVPADGGCTAAVAQCGMAHTWSLGVELTFYAALPLLVLLLGRIERRGPVARWMRWELLALAALAAISLWLRFYAGDPPADVFGTLIGWFFWFALGMGLAVVSVALEHRPRQPALIRLIESRPLLPWLAALGVYVALCLTITPYGFFLNHTEDVAAHLCFGLIALLLLAPAVFGDHAGGLPRRFLANPAVAWLGLISYGIFLWHAVVALELGANGAGAGFWPVLFGTVAITVPIAALSYYSVERPLLRFKYRRRAEPS